MDFLKAEQVGKNKYRVLAIPFGGPFKEDPTGRRPPRDGGYDLDGEFFSPRTDVKPDWFDRRPLVWHHNLDKSVEDSVIGTADDVEQDEEGWWTTVWLDRSNRYWERVNGLLSAQKIYGSSGALPNFVKTDPKTGEILVWPWIEETLTPTPSNFLSRVVAAKAMSHFDEANIGLPPALRGILSDLDSPTADLRPDLPYERGSLAVVVDGGDDAAIQTAPSDPNRDRIVRQLAGLVPRLEQLKNL